MKKLIFKSLFLIVLIFAIASCSKEKAIDSASSKPTDLYTVFKFSKKLQLHDADGNTATVKVSADKQDLLDEIGEKSLKLVVDKRDVSRLIAEVKNSTSTSTHKNKSSIAERWQAEGFDVVDIFVSDFSFNKGVTGFRIELVNNFRSWDKTMTQVGSTNINGSAVTCKGYSFSWTTSSNRPSGKLCTSEIVEVEFAGRNNWWNFWDNIQTNDLNSTTTVGRLNDIPTFDNYRLRWDFENCSSGDRPENRTFTFHMLP